MNILPNRLTLSAAALIALGTLSNSALAGLTTYTADMAGFTWDSDTTSSAFNAALGAGYTHISFSGSASSDGTSYSPDVTFSTIQTSNGGITGGSVNANGEEIGPFDSWYGGFDIDFNGGSVTTVGFGLVDPTNVTVYDTAGDSLGSFSAGDSTFTLWGVQATGGDEIGSVVLDGNFYAIQDIEFNTVQGGSGVPDGGTTVAMLGGAVFALASLRRRFKK